MITKEEIEQAVIKTIPDIITPNLTVLFCGINPGLYSAAIGHHFGRPGNRFWPILYEAGFTPRLYTPYEDREILKLGLGITNIVTRTTRSSKELKDSEFIKGRKILEEKIKKFKPKWIAFVGIEAYRKAFKNPRATTGLQDTTLFNSKVWVLPNPSGLNAYYQRENLISQFKKLKEASL